MCPIRETALKVNGLSNDALGLHDISFNVKRGEILGFAGLVGSGRTELARTLFGLSLLPAPSNSMEKKRESHLPRRQPVWESAISLRIGRQHGLVLEMGIAENISMASLKEVSQVGVNPKAPGDRSGREVCS